MKRIALKIDVDTFDGTRLGVPNLVALLNKHHAKGTFFFSLGPDMSGCQPAATSLKRFYNLKTRLLGRLLPAPSIGKRCCEILKQVQAAGFETGIHAWNRVAWEEGINRENNHWVETELKRATQCFTEIFDTPPKALAAPGWRSNRHAMRLTQRLGYAYASDCHGNQPFIPVIDGEIIACPQLPTTLPTLDEILAIEPGYTPEQAADRIIQLALSIPGDHVVTLRAELEGAKFPGLAERLLHAWKDAGCQVVALRELRASLDLDTLPRHTVLFGTIPGRSGERMTQGPRFLYE